MNPRDDDVQITLTREEASRVLAALRDAWSSGPNIESELEDEELLDYLVKLFSLAVE